jgi:hypothetical protein
MKHYKWQVTVMAMGSLLALFSTLLQGVTGPSWWVTRGTINIGWQARFLMISHEVGHVLELNHTFDAFDRLMFPMAEQATGGRLIRNEWRDANKAAGSIISTNEP